MIFRMCGYLITTSSGSPFDSSPCAKTARLQNFSGLFRRGCDPCSRQQNRCRNGAENPRVKRCSVNHEMQGIQPVSYTHLDVYKRQHTRRRQPELSAHDPLPTQPQSDRLVSIFPAQSQDYVPLTRQLDTNALAFHSALPAGEAWRRTRL